MVSKLLVSNRSVFHNQSRHMPEYAAILLILLLVTVFIHSRYKIKVFKSKSHWLTYFAILITMGVVWDHIAISRGHWFFGEEFMLGPRLGLMPIEELAFVVILGYFGPVLWKVVGEY